MRTYDKLIATIHDRRSTCTLHPCFGRVVDACRLFDQGHATFLTASG
jgi:hypothetical protein